MSVRAGALWLMNLASLIALSLATSAACDAGSTGHADAPGLTVFAASSLTEAFTELAAAFEARSGVPVAVSFAGSQTLSLQIAHGASADLFASANGRHVRATINAGQMAQGAAFASNDLTIIAAPGNPKGISGLSDLADVERVVIGDRASPIGGYTLKMLGKADAKLGPGLRERVLDRVVSMEMSVRQIRAKVALGAVDGAIVYTTDALSTGQVTAIPIDADINIRAAYFMALRPDAPDPAVRLRDFILSPAGQAILGRHGFGPAPSPMTPSPMTPSPMTPSPMMQVQ